MGRRPWTRWLAAAGILLLALLVLQREEGDIPPTTDREPGAEDSPRPVLEAPPRPSAPEPSPAPAPPSGVRFAPLDPALRGEGGVRLRVVRGTDGSPLAGAAVVLHGTGHAEEIVWRSGQSDAEGNVAFDAVPAGPWMTLRVSAPGEAEVIRADVDIAAGEVRDLGVIKVGERRALVVSVKGDGMRPVAGAFVTVRPVPPDAAMEMGSDQPSSVFAALDRRGEEVSERTSTEGVARLEGVTPGTWWVEATVPGRVGSRVLVEVSAVADPVVPTLLLRPGVLLRGRVVHRQGAAVAAARLMVSDGEGRIRPRAGSLPRVVIADGGGVFETALPASAFPGGLWVDAYGHPLTWVPMEAPAEDVVAVVGDGASLDLTAHDAETGEALPGARVEIRVIPDADAGPLPPRSWFAQEDARWIWHGQTDGEGGVHVVVPAGRLVELNVESGGYRIGRAPPFADADDAFIYLDVPEVLQQGQAVRVAARLSLRATTRLRGRVVGPGDRPIAGVVVHDHCYGSWPPEPRAVTDGTGEFVLECWPTIAGTSDESAWLRVLSPGWVVRRPWAATTADEHGGRVATLEVIPSTTLRGRAVDEAGRGVADAEVTWDGPDHGSVRPRIHTAGDGRFVIPDLASGGPSPAQDRDGRVRILARGYQVTWSGSFRVSPGRTTDVGDLVLRRGRVVQGIVRDAAGAPAPGVRVSLLPTAWINPPGIRPEDVYFTLTDGAGRFRAEGLWQHGLQVEATARGPEELPASVEVQLREDAPNAEVELRLTAGVAVEGVVVDSEGQPIPHVRVRIGATDGTDGRPPSALPGWQAKTRTDVAGRFRFPAAPRGGVSLYAFLSSPDREGRQEVELPVEGDLRLVVRPGTDEGPPFGWSIYGMFEEVTTPPEETAWR